MKKAILLILLNLMIFLGLLAQSNYGSWTYELKRIDTGAYNLKIKAIIDDKYYIYGMNIKEGPLPLEFIFENQDENIISYDIKEISIPEVTFDEVFGSNVSTHSKKAEFECTFVPKTNVNSLNLIIQGQACNKKDGSCFPINEILSIKL